MCQSEAKDILLHTRTQDYVTSQPDNLTNPQWSQVYLPPSSYVSGSLLTALLLRVRESLVKVLGTVEASSTQERETPTSLADCHSVCVLELVVPWHLVRLNNL